MEPPPIPQKAARETAPLRQRSSESSSYIHESPEHTQDELGQQLARCGLSRYRQTFIVAGFTTWDSVLDIQESDLEALGVRRGHRRKLQRHIANYKNTQQFGGLQEVTPDSRGRKDANPEAHPADSRSNRLETSLNPFVSRLAIGKLPELSNHDISPSNRGPMETTRVISSASSDFETGDTGDSHLLKGKARLDSHAVHTSVLDGPFRGRREDSHHMQHERKAQAFPSNIQMTEGAEDRQRGHSVVSSSSMESTDDPQWYLRGRSPPGVLDARHRVVTDSERRRFHDLVRQTRRVLEELIEDNDAGALRLDENTIPPRAILTEDVNAFFEATRSIFFMFTSDDTDTLLDHVFNTEGSSIDPVAVAELVVIAAVGRSHGKDPENARTFRRQCYHSCLRFLEHDANVSHLRYMRFFLCLSISCAMDDYQSSSVVLRTAQYIGHTHPLLTPSNGPSEHTKGSYWRQMFGSVVIFRHLFYSLDDAIPLTNRDMEIASHRLQISAHSFQEDIQSETSRAAILITNLLHYTTATEDLNLRAIHAQYRKVLAWHHELPPTLRFPTNESQGSRTLTDNERCYVLVMHMFVSSMTASAFRSMLFSTAAAGDMRSSWPSEAYRDDVYKYRDNCVRAAQRSGQIASLLTSNSENFTTLWTMSHQAFTTCSILLYCAARQVLRHLPEKVGDNLAAAGGCVKLLRYCARTQNKAQHDIAKILPVYKDLSSLAARPHMGRRQSSSPSTQRPFQNAKGKGKLKQGVNLDDPGQESNDVYHDLVERTYALCTI